LGDSPVVVLQEIGWKGRVCGEPSHTPVFEPVGYMSLAINANECSAFDVHAHSLVSSYDVFGRRAGPVWVLGVGALVLHILNDQV